MTYFAYAPAPITIIKSATYALPLLLSLSLIGCDNRSSTTEESADSQTAIVTAEADDAAKKPSSTPSSETDDAALEDDQEGQSLIAAAKSDRNIQTAQNHTDSTLQATLIGDYIGILPCDFCTSTEVTLNLFADGSVLKTSVYQPPETSKEPLAEAGIYRQDKDIITIVYDDQNIDNYLIENNYLLLLDTNKQPLSEYTLSRK